MNDLIDRYVHQVGLYVPTNERREIEAELRSQIHDQLEGTATATEVAAVLKQLGDPQRMAASYSGEQFLVGPELYPFLRIVLRFGLPLVPTVVVVANVLGVVLTPAGGDWLTLAIGSVFTAAQAALIFFAIVVLFFAILQHSGERFAFRRAEFDPLALPPVDDPGAVDRAESGFGIAIGTLVVIALLYFLQVGGLTLRFSFSDPGGVLAVPSVWLITLLVTTSLVVLLNLWALLRRRWTLEMWLAQTLLELVGAVGLYFILFQPVTQLIVQAAPDLIDLLRELPWMITLITVVIMVLSNGSRIIRLWQHRRETHGLN